jgi:hypothetical protein
VGETFSFNEAKNQLNHRLRSSAHRTNTTVKLRIEEATRKYVTITILDAREIAGNGGAVDIKMRSPVQYCRSHTALLPFAPSRWQLIFAETHWPLFEHA